MEAKSRDLRGDCGKLPSLRGRTEAPQTCCVSGFYTLFGGDEDAEENRSYLSEKVRKRCATLTQGVRRLPG